MLGNFHRNDVIEVGRDLWWMVVWCITPLQAGPRGIICPGQCSGLWRSLRRATPQLLLAACASAHLRSQWKVLPDIQKESPSISVCLHRLLYWVLNEKSLTPSSLHPHFLFFSLYIDRAPFGTFSFLEWTFSAFSAVHCKSLHHLHSTLLYSVNYINSTILLY